MTDAHAGHAHSHFALGASLLDEGERFSLGLRLSLALACAGLLLLALGLLIVAPQQAELAHLIAGIAALIVAVPVFTEAIAGLRTPTLHAITDQLVAVAVLAAWVVGDLESAALVPLFMVIGHILEERSLLGSQEAIAALARLTRTKARKLVNGAVIEVEAGELHPGDRLEVRPGDRLAADGVVRLGVSSVDNASLTGESVPIEVASGDAVLAGAINLGGRLDVEVTRTGADTTLGKVVSLMRAAERAKPPVTRLLERHAGHYLFFVLLLAAATWFVTSSATAMMTVLVAACPCALVLAAPATAIAAIAVAGRFGILVKGTAFLEELAEVDALVIDKTGTVTIGELRLVATRPVSAAAEADQRLRLIAASLGAGSSHPVSRAVASAVPASERLLVDGLAEHPGLGVTGTVAGSAVALGRAAFLAQRMDLNRSPADSQAASHAANGLEIPLHDGPVVGVVSDGALLGWLLLADEPRAEARHALADLRHLGLKHQVLLTGDRRSVAERIAGQLGITVVEAEVLPDQKLARVRAELAAGHRPLVVGDGVNDALALKAGAVGVAMGGKGTDVALASADVVLMSDDLRRLGTCIRLARSARRTTNINVAVGLGWTALILAGGTIGWYGPLAAALLHNLGTLAVMANAGRLLRYDDQTA
ncbi:metal-transporting ATPase [Planctomycetota bacterium]|nr:metal-transporting ATPase [Planctomycetota bacterium]